MARLILKIFICLAMIGFVASLIVNLPFCFSTHQAAKMHLILVLFTGLFVVFIPLLMVHMEYGNINFTGTDRKPINPLAGVPDWMRDVLLFLSMYAVLNLGIFFYAFFGPVEQIDQDNQPKIKTQKIVKARDEKKNKNFTPIIMPFSSVFMVMFMASAMGLWNSMKMIPEGNVKKT